jgi:hypothetical protein
VRVYGPDIHQRFVDVGFRVTMLDGSQIDKAEVERFGLLEKASKEVFVCQKR